LFKGRSKGQNTKLSPFRAGGMCSNHCVLSSL